MPQRQYSSCRTVNRMGTFAPAWSQPSGQEFLRLEFGSGGLWEVGHGASHLNVRVGALRLWPAGQREGGNGAPPRGRRPTVVAVQASILWADVKEQGDADLQEVHLRTGELAPGCWFTSRDLGIEAVDDRLLHHCIHTDPDGAGPAHGEPCVGRRDPRAKPEAIVEPLPIPSRRDDHRRGSHILGSIRNCRN